MFLLGIGLVTEFATVVVYVLSSSRRETDRVIPVDVCALFFLIRLFGRDRDLCQ